jgi:hypothetical protein
VASMTLLVSDSHSLLQTEILILSIVHLVLLALRGFAIALHATSVVLQLGSTLIVMIVALWNGVLLSRSGLAMAVHPHALSVAFAYLAALPLGAVMTPFRGAFFHLSIPVSVPEHT